MEVCKRSLDQSSEFCVDTEKEDWSAVAVDKPSKNARKRKARQNKKAQDIDHSTNGIANINISGAASTSSNNIPVANSTQSTNFNVFQYYLDPQQYSNTTSEDIKQNDVDNSGSNSKQSTPQSTQPTTKQATMQSTQPTTKQATILSTQPTTKQSKQPTPKQATMQFTQPTTKQTTMKSTQSTPKQATMQFTQPTTKQTTMKSTQPTTKQATIQSAQPMKKQGTTQSAEPTITSALQAQVAKLTISGISTSTLPVTVPKLVTPPKSSGTLSGSSLKQVTKPVSQPKNSAMQSSNRTKHGRKVFVPSKNISIQAPNSSKKQSAKPFTPTKPNSAQPASFPSQAPNSLSQGRNNTTQDARFLNEDSNNFGRSRNNNNMQHIRPSTSSYPNAARSTQAARYSGGVTNKFSQDKYPTGNSNEPGRNFSSQDESCTQAESSVRYYNESANNFAQDKFPTQASSYSDEPANDSQQHNTCSSTTIPGPFSNASSVDSFETLAPLVMPETMLAIRKIGFSTMREIQARTIPSLLKGRNLRGTAATGSGKTLAFIIPAVDKLRREGFKAEQGLGVLVLSPTRELAMQIESVLQQFLGPRPYYRHALVMGGTNRQKEVNAILTGVNIIVATPGRLLDHLNNTRGFRFSALSCLIIDEADMILSTGFEQELGKILSILPSRRQSMLFSATKGGKVERLVTQALGTVYDDVDLTVNKVNRLNTNVKQQFVVCPTYQRVVMLCKLLEEHRGGKVMVFFSLCKTVKLFDGILNSLGVNAASIHGNLSQNKRSETFLRFQNSKSMVMLCTDVAARGWDIPKVDLIVQVDPPTDASEFVHRVGRAAREVGSMGRAVLFMRPEELGYISFLKTNHRATLREYVVQQSELPQIQRHIYNAVHQDPTLLKLAKKVSRIYTKGYRQLKPSNCFVERTISSVQVDVSCGLLVDLPQGGAKDVQRKRESFKR